MSAQTTNEVGHPTDNGIKQVRVLLCVCLLLSACSTEQKPGEEYIQRLENVLDAKAKRSLIDTSSFPDARHLLIESVSGDLSIREFLSLRECRLHTVIARRNSALGKVATASQRLFNDLQILATGPACVEQLKDKALAAKLAHFLAIKERTIQQSLWLALLGEDENRSFWHAGHPNAKYPALLTAETTGDIHKLSTFVSNVINQNYDHSNNVYKDIEIHLGNLRYGDGGELLSSYARLTAILKQANQLIQARLSRPLCLNQKANDKARYFQNVVNKYFLNGLQQHAIKLNQRERQLMVPYRQFETPLLSVAPKPYIAWVERREQLIRAGQSASKKHAALIEQLYRQCNLRVGRPS